jgi:hypothetical protein
LIAVKRKPEQIKFFVRVKLVKIAGGKNRFVVSSAGVKNV